MNKERYFKVIGEIMLFLYFIIGFFYIVFIFNILINDSSNFLKELIVFLIFLIFTPTFSLLLISHSELLTRLNELNTAPKDISTPKIIVKPIDWTCTCGVINKGYIDICLTCGKEKIKE